MCEENMWGGCGLECKALSQRFDCVRELGVFLEKRMDLFNGVKDRRVILPAEGSSDLSERGVSELAGEIHSHLSGKGDCLGSIPRFEICGLKGIVLGDLTLDMVDADDFFLASPEVREDLLGEVDRHLATGQRANRDARR